MLYVHRLHRNVTRHWHSRHRQRGGTLRDREHCCHREQRRNLWTQHRTRTPCLCLTRLPSLPFQYRCAISRCVVSAEGSRKYAYGGAIVGEYSSYFILDESRIEDCVSSANIEVATGGALQMSFECRCDVGACAIINCTVTGLQRRSSGTPQGGVTYQDGGGAIELFSNCNSSMVACTVTRCVVHSTHDAYGGAHVRRTSSCLVREALPFRSHCRAPPQVDCSLSSVPIVDPQVRS